MSTVNAEVVEAALAQMLAVAMDRDEMQSVRLSILKRRIVSLQNQIDQQKTTEHPGTWIEAHDCASCVECIHDGAKCCGCYDGVCCQEGGADRKWIPGTPVVSEPHGQKITVRTNHADRSTDV